MITSEDWRAKWRLWLFVVYSKGPIQWLWFQREENQRWMFRRYNLSLLGVCVCVCVREREREQT